MKHSLTILRDLIEAEIKSRGGGESLSNDYIMQEVKKLRDKQTSMYDQQQRMLTEIARQDAEIIKLQEKWQAARAAYTRLVNKEDKDASAITKEGRDDSHTA